MNQFTHPSNLNAYQLYKQVNSVAKHTNRAKNPDWYAEALNIQRQWHLWIDGSEVVSALFDSSAKRWTEGPDVSWLGDEFDDEAFANGEQSEELRLALAEVLRSRELGGKVQSLGVILHVADEFAILDLSREYSSIGDHEEVQQALYASPTVVLGDSTADSLLHIWRVLPCWGVKEGRRNIVVQLGRRRESFFTAVRAYGESNNVAIVVTGVSAPLEVLRLAPLYLEYEQGRGEIIVMLYRNFSALAVLNQDGELLQMRSLAHRAGMEYPLALGETLMNTQASMGLPNPVVSILPMNNGSAQEQLSKELTAFFARKTPMDIGFNELDQIPAVQEIFGNRSEMLLGDGASLEALLEYKEWTANSTFSGLAAGWATQNFHPIPYEDEEKFPSWQELQLRKWFGVMKLTLSAAIVALAVWGGLKVAATTSTEAWQALRLEEGVANMGMVRLNSEEKDIIYWEGIMKKRSPAWLVMQLPLDLFAENSGVVMIDCIYDLTPIAVTGATAKQAKTLGYSRRWEIKGFVTAKDLQHLAKLGSKSYMKSFFEQMAEKYQAESFSMIPEERSLVVTFDRQQGKYPAAGMLPEKEGKNYTTSFTLVIIQRFPAEDGLAFPISGGKKAKAKVGGK